MDLSTLDPTKPTGGEGIDQGATRIRETRQAMVTSVGVAHALAGQHTFQTQALSALVSGNIAIDAGAISFSDGGGWFVSGGMSTEDSYKYSGQGYIQYGSRSVVGATHYHTGYKQYIPYWVVTANNYWAWGCPPLDYTWNTTQTTPPAGGQIRINAPSSNPGLCTQMYVHHTDRFFQPTGSTWIGNARPGYDIYVVTNGLYSRFKVLSQAVDSGTYHTIGVNFLAGFALTAGPASIQILPNNLQPWTPQTYTFRCNWGYGGAYVQVAGVPVTINSSGFSMEQNGDDMNVTWIIVPGLIVEANMVGFTSGQLSLDGVANQQEAVMRVVDCFCVMAAE